MLVNKDYLNASIWAFIAISALVFNSMFGSLAALVFLISGTVYSATSITYTINVCKENWALFLIPMWSLLSALWSDIPIIVIKGSIQLILTTVFAVVLANRLNINVFLRTVAIAMLLAMLMSFFSSRMALNGLTGEYSLIGIFNSKNFLAVNAALSLAVALSLFFNKSMDGFSRILGLILLIISILVLIKAKSLSAIIFVVLSVLISFFIVFYQNICLHQTTRKQCNWFISVIAVSLIVYFGIGIISGSFDELMYSLGKDPTLTGRTYIWDRGLEIIAEHPLFGVGSQSLFYIGNDIAEDIWAFAHVPSGAGFNFHNMYIDISVELGFLGLILFTSLIIMFFRKIFSLRKIELGSGNFFAILIFIYLFLQTFLEANWFQQFTIIHLFICIAWVYLKEETVNES